MQNPHTHERHLEMLKTALGPSLVALLADDDIIEIIEKEGKLCFELYMSAIDKGGFKVSEQLKKFAEFEGRVIK